MFWVSFDLASLGFEEEAALALPLPFSADFSSEKGLIASARAMRASILAVLIGNYERDKSINGGTSTSSTRTNESLRCSAYPRSLGWCIGRIREPIALNQFHSIHIEYLTNLWIVGVAVKAMEGEKMAGEGCQ